jgi:HSP20 family protein
MNRIEVARYPFDEFATDMERVVDTLLGRTVGNVLRSSAQEKFVPFLDLSETAEQYELTMDLPGVNPEDVKIEMHDGKLTVSGKRSTITDQKDKNYHRVERSSGNFLRSLSVGNEVDADKIEATYDHGVLHIKLPKSTKQQPKKIEIRTTGSK